MSIQREPLCYNSAMRRSTSRLDTERLLLALLWLLLISATSCSSGQGPLPSPVETEALPSSLPTQTKPVWNRISPAEVGSVSSVLVDPRDSLVLYLGAMSGRLYKSRDAGGTWTRILEPLDSFSSAGGHRPLAMHPSNSAILYTAQVVWGPGAGPEPFSSPIIVSKTADGGVTWQHIPVVQRQGRGGAAFQVLVFDPQNPKVIYAGSDAEGVFKSQDGGFTWDFKGPGKSEVFSLAVDPVDTQTVYASLNAGVYISRDGGSTWEESRAGVRFSQSVVAGRGGSVYVTPGGYSADRGCSWVSLPMSGERIALDADSDRVVYSANYGPANIFGENPGVVLSTDGGMNWSLIGERLTRGDIRDLVVSVTSPRTLYLATSDGLWSYSLPAPLPGQGAVEDIFKREARLLGFPILRPSYVPPGLSCGLSVGKCDKGFHAFWQKDNQRLGLDLACGNVGESGQKEAYPFRSTSATLLKGRQDSDFILLWREPGTEMGYTLGAKGLSWEEFLRVADSLRLVEP